MFDAEPEIAQTQGERVGIRSLRMLLAILCARKLNRKSTVNDGHIRGMLVGDFIADEGRDCASSDRRGLLRLGAGGQQLEAEANPSVKTRAARALVIVPKFELPILFEI